MKRIGIVGGFGAMASYELLGIILKHYSKNHTIQSDRDYPEIILHNLSGNMNELGEMVTIEPVLDSLNFLQHKVDVIILACNTLHEYYSVLQNSCAVPIINMIDITAQALVKKDIKEVTVLCSVACEKSAIHFEVFKSYGILVNYDINRDDINHLILQGIKNTITSADISLLQDNIKAHKHYVFGCTELSLFFNKINTTNITDSLQLLPFYI